MPASLRFEVLSTFESMRKQYPLLKQLNPTLTPERYEALLAAILKQGGYFQVGCFEGDQCVGLTGVWIGTQIWCGKFIEVDNFIVDEAYRGRGVGKKLLEWVEAKGKAENCEMARLDTYVVLEQAQRFYFAQGFKILGFHMVKSL